MDTYTKDGKRKLWVKVNCQACGKEKELEFKYYKDGAKHYCNNACSGKVCWEHLNKAPRTKIARRTKGPLSEYRGHFLRAKRRKQENDITPEYLKEVFELQDGVCVYSDVKLLHTSNDPIHQASLDRIDSSKGYIRGNVQFVSLICNMAKQHYPDSMMKAWIDLIRRKR